MKSLLDWPPSLVDEAEPTALIKLALECEAGRPGQAF
jgi:hypothetical protein